jgi:hypothetical protein
MTSDWQIFGLAINPDATALVRCPCCGHQLRDDLGLQLAGEPRWPIQGSRLTCPSCKSSGVVHYSGWVQPPNLATLWADVLQRLELPSTRLLLAQQGTLLSVDGHDRVVVVGIAEQWLPMAQARLPLLEAAMQAVLPDHRVVLNANTQAAAQLELPEADPIPPVEIAAGVAALPADQHTGLRQLVITPDPAPAVEPAAEDAEVVLFHPGQEPRLACRKDGVLRLPLSAWRRLHPGLDEHLRRVHTLCQSFRLLYGREPVEYAGRAVYAGEELQRVIHHACGGLEVVIPTPRWRVHGIDDAAA